MLKLFHLYFFVNDLMPVIDLTCYNLDIIIIMLVSKSLNQKEFRQKKTFAAEIANNITCNVFEYH